MTICVQVYMWAYVSVLLDIYLGVGLLSYTAFTCGYGVSSTNTGSKCLLRQDT